MKRIFFLIPEAFRVKGVLLILSSFIRALLNVVGLAAILPILYLILNPDDLISNSFFSALYRYGNFTSDSVFIIALCVVIICVFLIKNVLNILLIRFQNVYLLSLYQHFSRIMLLNYYQKGLYFIKQKNSVMLAHQVNNVSSSFVFHVLASIATILSEAMLLFMLFVAILIYNPIVSLLLILVFLPIAYMYMSLVKKKLQLYGKEECHIKRQQNRIVQETFKGYVEVEINNAFPSLLKRFEKNIQLLKEYKLKNERISTLPLLFMEMGVVCGLVILVLMNLSVEGNALKLLFGVFAIAALRMLPAIRMIMNKWMQIKYNQYTIDTIQESCNENNQNNFSKKTKRLSFNDTIHVDNISYAFQDDLSTPVLKDLSFVIHKGECIGIKGSSGVGKSTLFYLLMGFYFPDKGSIMVDGLKINPENYTPWQNIITYVSQDVFIMDTTLAQNIAMSLDDETIDREKINEILEIVKLKELVKNLPDGMDTPIREAANRLSGGEKQRIGIARALYKDAEVLFFDEATSALDTQTESEITDSIKQLTSTYKELTILMIAHRESSLSCCDRIIDIENIQK
ncbi:MAG: ABC transporter ATP-binding protein [Bacteroidales bacterium]|nr:ABC transporter ATP-binding protein [Bacteroidales bacterium]MDD4209405.1 ABC transporter ATP-binding protein [Bacteroidales bacterium]